MDLPLAALTVTATLMAARVAWVFPVFAISGRRRGTRRPSWPTAAVVSGAGTRGVVPLAAATIVISPIVQGFTLEPLARLEELAEDRAAPTR